MNNESKHAEWLSGVQDGHASAEELNAVLDALERQPALAQQWVAHQQLSSVLAQDRPWPAPDADRVASVMAAVARQPHRLSRGPTWWPPLAVAASMMAVAVGVLHSPGFVPVAGHEAQGLAGARFAPTFVDALNPSLAHRTFGVLPPAPAVPQRTFESSEAEDFWALAGDRE
ncbi:RseA family anti-sigma factor [Roseateles sp. BYS180W]|uniref:RseA family anti-sigma factor n=1 Tax=Roseateles rivi TaxID=3299028 RepID=A0ABW7FSH6_9BURK